MVESRSRKAFYFIIFLLPCLVLYTLFFIYPFINGFYISMTNWDGLTPKSPISMKADEFENRILNNVEKESDRKFLLSVYEKNENTNTWSRLSIGGLKRYRVERIMRKAGYEPESNRFVGFDNYKRILSGKIESSFYPRSFERTHYNKTSGLPVRIEKKGFQRNFLSKLTPQEKTVFDMYYMEEDKFYTLDPAYSEFEFEEMIWLIPEVETENRISTAAVSGFISELKTLSLAQNEETFDAVVSSFITENPLSSESLYAVKAGSDGLFNLGEVKNLLSDKWRSKGFDMGVIGFTLFFAFFSVIGINVLAFALALALDSGIKGQKILRSVFFLPNVLSMIIVALIWKMLFFQLFPKLTGIDQWLSDAAKTPWLLVMVAVWQGAGYYMIVYLAGLQNIPTDVIEATKIDGAKSWQRFFNITLPLLVPAITISLFLSIANALKSFDLIYAMTSGSAYTYGTVPVVLDIYFDAFARKQAGLATAKAMLLFIIIFAVTGLQLYVMKRKEVEQ
ncbi:sugar ABC transporter permease [Brucepastera parasyntrophica]|uniref:carbohydrate ABC transporter permease n=1 Tax=Brucepastera parasyntrophica TaxID=2880008 RepID=UPI0021096345|nr:sugar ABC transporter permease [Brucepastera parasyntrophica]ULQ60830.1 sugar ABC transporter permease [Brucepastera parasyntrophica]